MLSKMIDFLTASSYHLSNNNVVYSSFRPIPKDRGHFLELNLTAPFYPELGQTTFLGRTLRHFFGTFRVFISVVGKHKVYQLLAHLAHFTIHIQLWGDLNNFVNN